MTVSSNQDALRHFLIRDQTAGGGYALPRLDAALADKLVRRIERAPLFAHAYSLHLNFRFGRRRLVIDVSGDGRHNQSTGPTVQRELAVNMGITINGLAILNEDHQLDRYYRDHVIGGTGAFVMTADSYRDFAAAIVRKLVREISGSPLALLPREGPPDPKPKS